MRNCCPTAGRRQRLRRCSCRFNLDPVLIAALIAAAILHICIGGARARQRQRGRGWAIAAVALISPLCALSVSLFSARVGQHMVLILGAAPLLALATPEVSAGLGAAQHVVVGLGISRGIVVLAHAGALRRHVRQHAGLLGDASDALRQRRGIVACAACARRAQVSGDVLLAGVLTSMQMGFLGAILTTASRPLYFRHLSTSQIWGLTPLQDQALGGILMWVPGILLFLWASVHALGRLRALAERTHPA